jgi:hypothetical protein
MSPVVAEILQQIDRLPLLEQTNILRQLEQKIETTTNLNTSPTPIDSSQQQWQQAVDRIHDRNPISLDLQKTRISDLFAKFNAKVLHFPRLSPDAPSDDPNLVFLSFGRLDQSEQTDSRSHHDRQTNGRTFIVWVDKGWSVNSTLNSQLFQTDDCVVGNRRSLG